MFNQLTNCIILVFLLCPFVDFAQQDSIHIVVHKTISYKNSNLRNAKGLSLKRKTVSFIGKSQFLEIPALQKGEELIKHSAYSLVYAEKYEQAKWVAYQLTSNKTQKEFDRTNDFIPDPKIISNSASDSDYKNSGYDRGHLAPASDMGWSETAMAESFFYSNMSPQEPSFNRGIWKKGEDLVRRWAKTYGNLYIVVGPVLKKDLSTIGPNKVAVPKQYFKVILDYEGTAPKAIAFLMKNEGSKEMLQSFSISVDSIEKVTGIDFFPALPDDEEKQIERTVCLPCWIWTDDRRSQNTGLRAGGKITHCKGKKSDGSACKNYIAGSRQYCSDHIK